MPLSQQSPLANWGLLASDCRIKTNAACNRRYMMELPSYLDEEADSGSLKDYQVFLYPPEGIWGSHYCRLLQPVSMYFS